LVIDPAVMHRTRSCNDRFDVNVMADALTSFARVKDCPFDWELASYSKTKRSQGPDREGLVMYAPLLRKVLSVAPGGFPSFSLLREALVLLDEKFDIMDPRLRAAKKVRADWASDSADAVRRALRHVVEIKRWKSPFMAPAVGELVELVKDGAGRKSAMDGAPGELASPMPPPASSFGRQQRALSVHVSDESVQFCSALCKCPDCKPVPDLVDLQSPARSSPPGSPNSARSVTSMVAAGSAEIVDPARGGHKRAAVQMASCIGKGHAAKRPAAAPPAKKHPAASPPAMKRPAASHICQFKVVRRDNPEERKQAYIMNGKKYVIGLTHRVCNNYLQVIEQVRDELENAAIVGNEAAKRRVSELAGE